MTPAPMMTASAVLGTTGRGLLKIPGWRWDGALRSPGYR